MPSAFGVWLQRAVLWPASISVFIFSWLYRFNDPGGSFAGLTDDHFFYLIRAWQILFGDLPVRDFVDHGAPMYYYVGAAVQVVFGRGTLTELVFSTTALALGAVATFWLSYRASGSVLLGLLGAAFQILLAPRFYNYPKILAYATAIPLLWWFADRQSASPRFFLAATTVIWFLFRHDHGVFIACAMATLLLLLDDMSWRLRCRHALVYGGLVLALLAPYLAFIEYNGGLVAYLRDASAWAERDRARAPVEWPGLFDNPDGVSDAARQGSGLARVVAVVRDNTVAFTYYSELIIPILAAGTLLMSRDAFRPSWPRARSKLATVAVLALILDAGFLRSPLEARLADPSVPIAILIAWLAHAMPRLLFTRNRPPAAPASQSHAWALRGAAAVAIAAIGFVLVAGLTKDISGRLFRSALIGSSDEPLERAEKVAQRMREEWRLETWTARADRAGLMDLALYVNACTTPRDRVLVQGYMPQVLGMAQRAFAGGHADLRPGFFGAEEAQRLTVARLHAQSVPVILLESDQEYQNFRASFPLVMAYIDERYRLAETHVFDRFGINLFVRREVAPGGVWMPLGWPCFGSGEVATS